MIYKNISNSTKTFHGVTFRPGEIKEVPRCINNRYFIRLNSMPKEPPVSIESPTGKSKRRKTAVSDEPVEIIEKSSEILEEEKEINGTDSNQ